MLCRMTAQHTVKWNLGTLLEVSFLILLLMEVVTLQDETVKSLIKVISYGLNAVKWCFHSTKHWQASPAQCVITQECNHSYLQSIIKA